MNNFFSRVKTFATKNRPELLLIVGTVGLLATTVLAVKGTPKAVKLIEKRRAALGKDKLGPVEVIKTTWKCYIPAVATCIPSIVCMVGCGSQSVKRSAALATAYSVTESAFAEYRNKVIKSLGEKKEQSIKDDIAKDQINSKPLKSSEVIVTKRGDALCLDVITGRYFKSDIDLIKQIEEKLNHRLREDMFISLNEFYYELGLEPSKIGDMLGWDIKKGYIELNFSSQIAPDGNPCLVMDYSIAPQYDYH